MNKIVSDYFCCQIPKSVQEDPLLLLAMSGVLNSVSGKFKMYIESIRVEEESQLIFENTKRIKVTTKVEFANHDSLVRFNAIGSPAQCYAHVVDQFTKFVKEYDDKIYLQSHDIPSMEELMDNITFEREKPSTNLNTIQQQVDHWIKKVGVNYFDEMTNLSNLIEETGEVARLIGREFGQQSFKPEERPICVKTAIADELSDVLFIVVCLANQMEIDLDEAFARNMDKKTNRDKDRHQSNPALKLTN
ncbi:nucleotide pyrophosphohydrolase [Pseudidiomarina sp. CB1]|uniref:nucleotide pyrophosphohydrolase n=1 Tax=Pseudidiomarina sp. CB1 TaxID=2972484 RepID=UPI002163F53B|nr:nucleotide pyrophosphohydrolase [Pseudidiomarina sp. CB1]